MKRMRELDCNGWGHVYIAPGIPNVTKICSKCKGNGFTLTFVDKFRLWFGLPVRKFAVMALLAASIASGHCGSVTVLWNASPDTNVVGYWVYYGVAPRVYTNKVQPNPTINTSVAVTNLSAATTYYFAATAYDANGLESILSDEVPYNLSWSNRPPSPHSLLFFK